MVWLIEHVRSVEVIKDSFQCTLFELIQLRTTMKFNIFPTTIDFILLRLQIALM
jgi:hypothetical protein